MSYKVEITIAGAGVVGCAVAGLLAKQGHEVFVLELNPGVSQGENQSTRNSGVIHAGLYYDRATRPIKAALCAKGNRMLKEFCASYQVPSLWCGKLVVATRPEERAVLGTYQARAEENGVPVRLISGEEARAMEPQVKAIAALHLPTSGIIDAAALIHRLYADASKHSAQFLTGTRLAGVAPSSEGLELSVIYPDGARDSFLTSRLINCAGLYSDQVARMVNPDSPYRIDPMRGEAARFYRGKRPELALAGMNVYPCPHKLSTASGTYHTVGVHLTPTLEPGPDGSAAIGPVVTVGPLSREARDREEYGGRFHDMAEFHRRVAGFFPGLTVEDLAPHQVGIQARLVGHQDWVVELDLAQPACLNYLGIDSPGLTACLALAGLAPKLLFP